MRIAALVPTCDRAATAERSIVTFLAALRQLGLSESTTLVVVDDSRRPAQQAALDAAAGEIQRNHREVCIEVIRPQKPYRLPSLRNVQGGPGAARNHGLARLREIAADADMTVLFDDDVCFANADYQGVAFHSEGSTVLKQAIAAVRAPANIAGCPYVGRQDLSIIEHARLNPGGDANPGHLPPAISRASIELQAPGGISAAFLAIGAAPAILPDFPEHYNEDYVWLRALERSGWALRRISAPLIHAPPGDVTASISTLSFQTYGEIVWLAVSQVDRFPPSDRQALAQAIDEVTSELRQALTDPAVEQRPRVLSAVRHVLAHYGSIERQFADGRLGIVAQTLQDDIKRGLMLGR